MKRSRLSAQGRQPEIASGAEDVPQHLDQSLLGNQALLARLPNERPEAPAVPKGGRRLDPALAASFGGLMDTPLDEVRVHTGGEAAQTLAAVGGDAVTLGQHVFLGGPVADVNAPKGRRALAHELQHVGHDQRGEVVSEGGAAPVTAATEREAYGAEARLAGEAQALLGETGPAPATLTGPSAVSPERTPAPPSGAASAPETTTAPPMSAPAPAPIAATTAPAPKTAAPAPEVTAPTPTMRVDATTTTTATGGGPTLAPQTEPRPNTLGADAPGLEPGMFEEGGAGAEGGAGGLDLGGLAQTGASEEPVGAEAAAKAAASAQAQGEALAARLVAVGAQRQDAVMARIDAARERLAQAVATQEAALVGAFDAARASVREGAADARLVVEGARDAALLKTSAATAEAVVAVTEGHDAALAQARGEAALVREALTGLGEAEASRATTESARRAATANTLGKSASGGDARAVAQADVKAQIVAEGGPRCQALGAELAAAAQQATASASEGLSAQEAELATALGEGRDTATASVAAEGRRVEAELVQGATVTLEGITTSEQAALSALDADEAGQRAALHAQGQALGEQLDGLSAEVSGGVGAKIEEGAAALRAAAQDAAAQLSGMGQAPQGALGEAAARVDQALGEAAAGTITGVDGWGGETLAAIDGLERSAQTQLEQAGAESSAAAMTLGARLSAEQRGLGAEASAGLSAAAEEAAAKQASAAEGATGGFQRAAQGFTDAAWAAHAEVGQTITAKVDAGLAQEDTLLAEVQARADQAAASAGASYDTLSAEADRRQDAQEAESPTAQRGGWGGLGALWDGLTGWVADVRQWFITKLGERLGGFVFGALTGIAMIAVGWLVMLALEALIVAVAGLFVAAEAAATIGAVATVIIAALAAVGLGVYARFAEFSEDNPEGPSFLQGLALFGLGIADLTGIPLIIEGLVGQRAFGRELTLAESWERIGLGSVFFLTSVASLVRIARVRGGKPKAPKVEERAPKVEEKAPKVEEQAPKVEEDAPKVEEDVPKVEEDVPKVEEDAPKQNTDDAPQVRKGDERRHLGLSREATVAELTGGTVSREKLSTTAGSTDLDVLGPNGELIMVGGPAKAKDLGNLGRNIKIYKELASERGVKAMAYFTNDTPQSVIDFAVKRLSAENVKTFQE